MIETELPVLDPEERNRMVALLGGLTLEVGSHGRRERVPRGMALHAEDVGPWQHPWFTTARWDARLAKWRVNVLPGFVNGIDPTFNGTPLLDVPEPAVNGWRNVGGTLGVGNEPVPPFFLAQGVEKTHSAFSVSTDGQITDNTSELPPSSRRILRAVDIVLAVARPALTSQITLVDATGTSGQEVLYRVGMDTTYVMEKGTRPMLRLEQKYEPAHKPTLAERVTGLFADATEDKRLISTLYMLSPAGADETAEPDNTWKPYAKHATFWNLDHASRNTIPKEPLPPIRLFTFLAGGLGDLIDNQILAQINEYSDRVQDAVNNTTLEGEFWT
jgi:hypothetical protein